MNDKNICLRNFIIALFILSLNGCSSLPQFTSEYCKNKIVIDGDNSEWKDMPAYIDNNNVLAVSVCHDGEYIYVCMTTQDPQTQRQIMGSGLTVWFDPAGNDDKTFGVNFPLNRHSSGPPRGLEGEMNRDSDRFQQVMDQPSLEIEIVGPKESDRYRLSVANNEGIQAKIGRTKDGLMVYELQVPLRRTTIHPNAVNPKKDFVGLGFETGTMQHGSEKMRSEQGGRSGGFNGSGPSGEMGSGHRGGGWSGRGRGQHGSSSGSGTIPEPVKMWWKVKL